MPSSVLQRTINEVATSAAQEQMGERLLGRHCLDTSSPGRRLARLELAELALGYANGWAFGPKSTEDTADTAQLASRCAGPILWCVRCVPSSRTLAQFSAPVCGKKHTGHVHGFGRGLRAT